jgi:hypothetical protein
MAAKKKKTKTKNEPTQAPIPVCPAGAKCAEPSCHEHGEPHTG